MKIKRGQSCFVAAAIHNGHQMRAELLPYCRLSEVDRMREEDPYTSEWIEIADNQIRVLTSRFEVDINRPREKAVYLHPDDAWGLDVWNDKLPDEIVERSLLIYDELYSRLEVFFDDLLEVHTHLIVYDLHSYNHQRDGFEKYATARKNPEVNIGTGNLNRNVWADVIETLMESLRAHNFEGRKLSVGENVKFRGGYFGEWLVNRYQDAVCPISIEVKKFFMNEWTGEIFEPQLRHIRELLISTIRPVSEQASLISNAR
jgi:N-formylglutamate amidohydrolase